MKQSLPRRSPRSQRPSQCDIRSTRRASGATTTESPKVATISPRHRTRQALRSTSSKRKGPPSPQISEPINSKRHPQLPSSVERINAECETDPARKSTNHTSPVGCSKHTSNPEQLEDVTPFRGQPGKADRSVQKQNKETPSLQQLSKVTSFPEPSLKDTHASIQVNEKTASPQRADATVPRPEPENVYNPLLRNAKDRQESTPSQRKALDTTYLLRTAGATKSREGISHRVRSLCTSSSPNQHSVRERREAQPDPPVAPIMPPRQITRKRAREQHPHKPNSDTVANGPGPNPQKQRRLSLAQKTTEEIHSRLHDGTSDRIPIPAQNADESRVGTGLAASPEVNSRDEGQQDEEFCTPLSNPNSRRQTEEMDLMALFPDDIEAVTKVIKESERRMIQQVVAVQKDLLQRVNRCETRINDVKETTQAVRDIISDLRVIALKSSAAAANRTVSPGSNPKSKRILTLKQEVERLFPTLHDEMNIAFGPEIFCFACAKYVVSYTTSCHENQDDTRMTSRTLAVMLYGLTNKLAKSEFKHGIGKKHADFRFSLAKKCISQAMKLSDESFKAIDQRAIPEPLRDTITNSTTSRSLSTVKPSWLHPGFVSRDTMQMARKFHECVKTELPPLPRDPSKMLAVHIGRHVVNTVNDMLRLSRGRCKRKVFEAGLFLLGDWSTAKCFQVGVHSAPKIRFMWQDEPPIHPSEMPESHAETVPDHNARNSSLLNRIIMQRKEMLLEVEYTVSVTLRSLSDRRRNDGESVVRTMTRHINILRIAFAFFEACCQLPSQSCLSLHRLTLRTVYRVALLFREFFIDSVDSDVSPRAPLSRTSTIQEEHNVGSSDALTVGDLEQTQHRGISTPLTSIHPEAPCTSDVRNGSSYGIPQVTLPDLLPIKTEFHKEMEKVLCISEETFERIRRKDMEVGAESTGADGRNGNTNENSNGEDDIGLESEDADMEGMLD